MTKPPATKPLKRVKFDAPKKGVFAIALHQQSVVPVVARDRHTAAGICPMVAPEKWTNVEWRREWGDDPARKIKITVRR